MPESLTRTLSDMLMELGNIGCCRALSSLSKFTSRQFSISTPIAEIIEYRAMTEKLGESEEEMISIMLDITGQLKGVFLVILKPQIAASLLEALGAIRPKNMSSLDDYAKSALMELGNIMACAYLNAVYKLTGLETVSDVPAYAADMLGAILNMPIVRFAKDNTRLLYIQNIFTIENDDFVGSTLLIPTKESSDLLIKSLEARL